MKIITDKENILYLLTSNDSFQLLFLLHLLYCNLQGIFYIQVNVGWRTTESQTKETECFLS